VAVEARQHLALVPDMVPAGQHIDAYGDELVGDLRGQPKPAGRVLCVRDDQVDRMLAPQLREEPCHGFTTGAADDISYRKNGHIHGRIVAEQ